MIKITAFLCLVSFSLCSILHLHEGTEENLCLQRVGQICVKCALGFVSTEQLCVKPQKEIKDCISYISETECAQCLFRRQLSEDKSECKKITMKNCLLQSGE